MVKRYKMNNYRREIFKYLAMQQSDSDPFYDLNTFNCKNEFKIFASIVQI